MTFEEIYAIDTSNMYKLLREFPRQVRDAVKIGTSARLTKSPRAVDSIVLCGLGGSAIGGDLLRSYLLGELRIPFVVSRNYTIPSFVNHHSLVIISSYSGNTEETIAAHKEALKRRAATMCISSNGKTEAMAKRSRAPFIKLPPGFPPRAALGYSFFPLLIALNRLGLVAQKSGQIRETVALLETKAEQYGNPDPATNPALQLAEQLRGRLAIVYSGAERFDSVNLRWRGQIAENAKALAFGHVIPEMNHNELVGWKVLADAMREMHVIFLRDKQDHKRVQVRMDITKSVISQYTSHITEVWSEGASLLARMFSLIYLGDWVSYYLALLHAEDPTPVKVIDHLKTELAKVKSP
jgi:glucose/mannose-6-phosphate isomerase